MKNTKNKILLAARELFNEQGYFQVTIRMISQQLGISSGNLNYHFKTRKDILHSLYFEMVAVFDKRVETLGEQTISLPFVYESIKISMERMIDYRFIWIDLYHLLQEDEAIKKHFQKAYKLRQKGYQQLFGTLIQMGIMHPPAFPKEHTYLATRMIQYGNGWLHMDALYQKQRKKDKVAYHAIVLLSMLFPYLTKRGQQAYKELESIAL